jgi:RNA polymerase sigma-70 factor (ECF subfamily)
MNPDDRSLAAMEEDRDRLRSIALRILGSVSDADDALQEVWIRTARADLDEVENLQGWLTTVTARVCLNLLRSRTARREDGFDLVRADAADPGAGPDEAAGVAESVQVALLIVLDELQPAERVAFVLHDLFAVPFDQVAEITGRTPAAARKLASRARRKVRSSEHDQAGSLRADHEVVAAFYAAARGGDLERLLVLLDPDVVLETTAGPHGPAVVVRGAATIAGRALRFAHPDAVLTPIQVQANPGVLATVAGGPLSLMVFQVENGTIRRIDALVDPDRLSAL